MASCHVVAKVRGLPRPRFARNGRAYMPSWCEPYKRLIADSYRRQCGGFPYGGAVAVEIAYRRPLPESRPKAVESEPDTYKPDLDNVAKAVLDALNGVAFKDDRQVTTLTVRKLPRERGAQEEMFITVKPDTGYRGE